MIKNSGHATALIKNKGRNIEKVMHNGGQYFPEIGVPVTIKITNVLYNAVYFYISNNEVYDDNFNISLNSKTSVNISEYVDTNGVYHPITSNMAGKLYVHAYQYHLSYPQFNESTYKVWNGEDVVKVPPYPHIIFLNTSSVGNQPQSAIVSDTNNLQSNCVAYNRGVKFGFGESIVINRVNINASNTYRRIEAEDANNVINPVFRYTSFQSSSGSCGGISGNWVGDDMVTTD